MDTKTKIKNKMSDYNPLATRRRHKMRQKLTNLTPSLLAPNCMGGILFHDLGLKFFSPTVNLMMFQTDFVKLVCNLDHYLAMPLCFFEHSEYKFPCAKLGDLTIHFTHYLSEEEAADKWNERCKRIDRDNLFVFAMERDGITKQNILELGSIKAKGIVVFTAHDYPDIPYACYVPKFSRNGIVEDVLQRSYLDDHRLYEEVFDFVGWFNEANGGDYDVRNFIK